MKQCLKVHQNTERTHFVLLDVNCICLLNAETETITTRIPYKVDFSRLLKQATHALCRVCKQAKSLGDRSGRKISDDGKSVLIGWDQNNKRSILVTPESEQGECERLIAAANGSLSDSCALSPTGTSTCFVDLDDLDDGTLTVGVFDERSECLFPTAAVDVASYRWKDSKSLSHL